MTDPTFHYLILGFLSAIMSVQPDIEDWIGAISSLAAIGFGGAAIYSEFFI